MEKQIKNLMKTLDLTREQALELIESDKRIDKGEKLFELTDEQKANAKKATNVGTRKSTPKAKRERKADTDKADIITMLVNSLEGTTNLVITNAEREINFEYNGRKFKIVLSAPRT